MDSNAATVLRHASLCQALHALAMRDVTSEALTRAFLDAIGEQNGLLNAYLHVDAGGALRAAQAADARRAQGRPLGRFDGVPLAIKDNLDVAGMPTTAGLPARRGRIAETDAFAVARLRAAGAVLLGKTNLDEAALGTASANPHFGTVQNPVHTGYSAGGSSGGSAAAVAAGLCTAALGTDTLGSIRVPAASCGVVGLRPTHGEVSQSGLFVVARRLDCIGPITRTVADAALLLQAIAGFDAQDPASRARRVALATPDWEPGRLRCGVLAGLPELGAADVTLATFEAALARLAPALGQRVSVSLPGYDFTRMRRAGLLRIEAELLAAHAGDLQGVSASLADLLDFARRSSAAQLAQADLLIDRALLIARALFEQVDILILPTTPQPPQPHQAAGAANDTDLTAFASLAGCPALSLPMGRGADRLPLGLQLVGARGSDLRLLELGEVLAAMLAD